MFLKRTIKEKDIKEGVDIELDINIYHINNLTEKEIHALAGKNIREVNAMTGYVVEPVCNAITNQLADIMDYMDVVRLEEKKYNRAEYYIYRCKELVCWRNEKRIQEIVHNAFQREGKIVKNTVLHAMPEDLVAILDNKYCNGLLSGYEDGILVYHEWH